MAQSSAVAELVAAIAELQSYANTNDEASAVRELVQPSLTWTKSLLDPEMSPSRAGRVSVTLSPTAVE